MIEGAIQVALKKISSAAALYAAYFITLSLAFGVNLTSAQAQGNGPDDTINLAVFKGGWVNLMDYVADQQGFFKERGLQVNFNYFTSGPAELAAALSGDIDVFNTATSLTLPATRNGACVKYVTAGQFNYYSVIAQAGTIPAEATDKAARLRTLKGKLVGVTARGAGSEIVLRTLLASAGLDPDRDVTFVPVGGIDTMIAAFGQRTIDAMITIPPVPQMLDEQSFNYVVASNDAEEIWENIGGANATTCAALESKPQAILKYCQAVWDAVEYIRDPANFEGVVDSYVEHAKLDPAIARKTWESQKDAWTAELTEERWLLQPKFLPPSLKIETMPPIADSVVAECVLSDPRK